MIDAAGTGRSLTLISGVHANHYYYTHRACARCRRYRGALLSPGHHSLASAAAAVEAAVATKAAQLTAAHSAHRYPRRAEPHTH